MLLCVVHTATCQSVLILRYLVGSRMPLASSEVVEIRSDARCGVAV